MMTPDPEYLFMTKVHREALLGMFNAIERRKGLMVLTGEAGSGKTTLVRKVMASMPAAKAKFSPMLNPTPERVGLSLVEGKEDRRGSRERRRASRSHIPALFVYYWTGGVSPPHKVLDISEIGACFEARDRWPAGTIIELTLQRMLGADGSPADTDTSLRVACKVVRSEPGRLGVMFICRQRQELQRVRKFLTLSAAA
jgi:energy-coupling factor transporter ATP-binding protein EcfA2